MKETSLGEEEEETPQPRRLYKVWKGSNKFICGGRLIFGPDVASLFLSALLIAGPAIAFCWQMIEKINNQEENIQNMVTFVAVIVTLSDLIFLFLTSGRDPGIVPRNSRPPESDEGFDVTTPSMEWVHGRTPHLRLPRTKDVIVNGCAVKVKYCDTCLLYRPPRASHCSVCNNCVQRFDHHCPWVGQCIGLRNYRFFFLFISTSTFLCIYVFTFSWVNIYEEKKLQNLELWKAIKGHGLSIALIVYTFIAVWFVGGLTIFHLYLISTNQTTYENFRYRYDKRENPYNKGLLRNFKELFFTRIPPSLNNFRSWVIDEQIEVGSATPSTGIDMISPKEKIDIEMGSKFMMGGNESIPSILRNLDYSAIDENLKYNHRRDENGSDAFTFPTIEEQQDSEQNKITEDIIVESTSIRTTGQVEKSAGEGSAFDGTATSLDQEVHILGQ
ncbi:putative S-acyltransferase [Acorus gramineus]|uniref:S-acyltransferase n=1 Tax=Acorus gramineus TaxID=55184 RepID=A0AAV9A0G3_ACOGR|nr:putative S-acyltransferase [Acorus gramineus]